MLPSWRKNARIVLVDQSKEGWGFINADCFYQSDTKLEKEIFAKRMLVTHRYLNIPVKMGAVIEQMDIWIGDKMVRNMEVELAAMNPIIGLHWRSRIGLGKNYG